MTEPMGLPPLWKQYSTEFRHRIIGRTMLPLSLLYHRDIGGSLHTTFAFRINGSDGGEWYVNMSPDSQTFGEGIAEQPGLLIQMRETAVFYQMLTGRLNPPLALIRGDLKLRGDLGLFLRMGKLFSVDARP